MKDFMFVFRGGSSKNHFSPEQMQGHMQKWFNWINDLKAKEIYIAGNPLLATGKVVKGEKPVVTDGPFAESKELVGGYFLIKANSIEEAAELAKGCPDFSLE